MSQTIDQKVVEMRFDNTQFKQAVGETQKILKDFNSDLDFDNTGKGIDKFGDSLDKVKVKFSLLQTAAITAIANITNRFVDSSIKIVKALSIDQISSGWQKYAEHTTAVQTIMSAVSDKIEDEGERMEYVNEQIERLNWFTDETSYSLVDMTSNIGKFVAAGVDLPKAVDAMQGIATWAALSGANAQTASHAMSQLAQAMGTGVVKLQDWVSIENANMATKQFKEMAIDTALSEEFGTLKRDKKGVIYAPNNKKGVDVTTDNFRSTLQEGWLTSEVLTKTLERYGKFATKLEGLSSDLLEGEYETTSKLIDSVEAYRDAVDEAGKDKILQKYAKKTGKSIEELRKQFEELASDELGLKAFKAAQEAKTFAEAVQSVKDAVSTGWMNSFRKIFGGYDKAKVLWTDLANELWDIFNGGAEDRNDILNKWVEGGGQEHVHDIIIGLTTLVKDFKEAWIQAMEAVFGSTDNESKAKRLLSFTERVKNFVEGLALFTRDEQGDIISLTERGEKVVSVFKTFLTIIKSVGKVFSTVFKAVYKVVKSVWKALKILIEGFAAFYRGFKGFFDAIKRLREALSLGPYGFKTAREMTVFQKIAEKLKEWSRAFDKAKFLHSMEKWGAKTAEFLLVAWNFAKKIPEKINTLFTKIFGIGIGAAIQKAWNSIKAFFKWLSDQGILSTIWNAIKSFFTWLWNGLKSILGVESFAELAEKAKNIFDFIFTFLKDLFKGIFNGITKKDESEIESKGTLTKRFLETVFEIVRSIADFAITSASAIVKSFNPGSTIESFADLVQVLLGGISKIIQAADWKTILSSFTGLSMFVKTLNGGKKANSVLKDLSSTVLNFAMGYQNVTWALYEFSVAVKKGARAFKYQAIAEFFKSIALLIGVLALTVFVIGKQMSEEELGKGMAAIISMLVTVGILAVVVEQSAGKAGNKAFTATLFLLAFTILIGSIARAIKKIAKLDPERANAAAQALTNVLGTLVIGLIAILAVTKAVSVGKILSLAPLFLAVGLAISSITVALALLSLMNADSITKAAKALNEIISVIAIVIVILAATTKIAPSVGKLLLASLAFVMIGSIVATISWALAPLALMNPERVQTAALSLVTILSALTLTVVAIALISKITNPGKILASTLLFTMIGVIIAAITISLSALVLMNPDKIKAAADGVTKILTRMALMVSLLALISILARPVKMVSIAILFTAMGAVVTAIIIAMSTLIWAGPDKIKAAADGAVRILESITKAMKKLVFVSMIASPKKLQAMSIMIAAFGAAIAAIMLSMSMLFGMEVGKIKTAGDVVTKIIKTMSVMVMLLSAVSIVARPVKMLTMAVMFVAMASAILILTPALLAMSVIPADRVNGIVKMLVTFFLGIAALSVVSNLVNPAKMLALSLAMVVVSASIIVLAVGLTTLVPILTALAAISNKKLLKAILVIAAMFAILAIGGRVIEGALPGLLGFAAFVAIISVSALVLSSALAILGPAITALGTALLFFCDVVMDNADDIKRAFVTVAKAFVEAVVVIASSIGTIITATLESISETLPAVAKFFLSFIEVLCIVIRDAIPMILESLTTLILSVLQTLKDLAGPIIETVLTIIDQVFTSLVEHAPSICDSIMKIFIIILDSMAKYGDEVITSLTNLIVSIIEGLVKNENLKRLVAAVVDLLVELLNVLGGEIGRILDAVFGFIGKLLNGILDGINEDILAPIRKKIVMAIETLLGAPLEGVLGSVGMGLSEFAKQAKDFFDIIGQVDPKALDALGSLGGFILAVTANAVVDGITKILSFGTGQSSLGKFGKELKDFAEPLVEFSDKIKGKVDADSIEAVGNAAKVMASLYEHLPRTGGWLQSLVGEIKDLGTFGTELATFGTSFATFYESIKDLEVDAGLVDVVANAAEIMASLYDHMPRTGGWLQTLIGEVKDLGTFGTEMASFGTEFKTFYASIEGLEVDTGLVDTVTTVAKTMASLYDYMPRTGGWLQGLIGEIKDLGTFGNEMANFAKGFTGFAGEISRSDYAFDKTKILFASSIASTFASIYEKLKADGAVAALVDWGRAATGTDQLTTFGTGMKNFAAGFTGFANEISTGTFDANKIAFATTVASTFADIYRILIKDKTIDNVLSWFADVTHTDKLSMFGGQIATLGTSMKQFATAVASDDFADTRIETAKKYLSTFTDFALNMGGTIAEDAASNIFSIETAISGLIRDAENYTKPGMGKDVMYNAGENVAKTFFNGLTDGFTTMSLAFSSNQSTASTALQQMFGADNVNSADSPWMKFVSAIIKFFETGTGYSNIQSAASKMMTAFINKLKSQFEIEANQLTNVNNTNEKQLGGKVRAFLDALATNMETYMSGLAYQTLIQHTGYWVAKGLADGINENQDLVGAAGRNLGAIVDREFRVGQEIQSPSRVMYQNGVYVVQGLVNGINENLHPAELSGESLADSTLDGFQKAMLAANDYVTDSMGGPLTLTPVLDLSEIQNGTNQLSQMMSSVDGYSLDGSSRFASDAYLSRHISESAFSGASVDRLTNAIEDLIQNPQASNFANTFNINGTNAHEIAEEVSRILQMQVERRNAVWG